MTENAKKRDYFVKVDLEDLQNFDEELVTIVRNQPLEFMPTVSVNSHN